MALQLHKLPLDPSTHRYGPPNLYRSTTQPKHLRTHALKPTFERLSKSHENTSQPFTTQPRKTLWKAYRRHQRSTVVARIMVLVVREGMAYDCISRTEDFEGKMVINTSKSGDFSEICAMGGASAKILRRSCTNFAHNPSKYIDKYIPT